MTEQEELEAFIGLNESYIEMEEKIIAPACHMTKMDFNIGDDDSWWECKHCGHTKHCSWTP